MALLILPIIIIASQEALRAVPPSLREAAYGLGATKWEVIWHHVLPSALPGILTGTILAVSRAIGETAPLMVAGASGFLLFRPDSLDSNYTVLPMQIYNWTARPQQEFRDLAAAGIIVLLVVLLVMNSLAIVIRQRFTRKLRG
jgi:phosphate transport system permease protein